MFKDAVAIGGFLFFCALAILFGMTCFSGKSDGAFFVAVACAVIALRFLGIGSACYHPDSDPDRLGHWRKQWVYENGKWDKRWRLD